MFDWFIDLAYSFVGIEYLLYILLILSVYFFLWVCADEHDKRYELEENFKKYEKLQDFVEFIYSNDKRDIEKDIDKYILNKKFKEKDEEYEKEKDELFKIF